MAERTIPLFPRGILNATSSIFSEVINATGGVLTSSLTVNGPETVTGTNTNNGDLNVNGVVTINGDLDVGGALVVAGGTVTPTPSGSVMPYTASGTPSPEWLLCDGTSYATALYPTLFAVIGYTYGGAGAVFNVPDLRGRLVINEDSGAGVMTSNNTVSATSGTEMHTLTVPEMAAHAHTGSTPVGPGEGAHAHTFTGSGTTSGFDGSHTNSATATGGTHDHTFFYSQGGIRTTTPVGGMVFIVGGTDFLRDPDIYGFFNVVWGGGGLGDVGTGTSGASGGHNHNWNVTGTTTGESVHSHTATIDATGLGTPHNNMQHYMVLNYIIKT